MKEFLFIISIIFISSCSKTYSCCSSYDDYETEVSAINKKQAETKCMMYADDVGNYLTVCKE